MMQIPISDIEKIPYIDSKNLRGRTISTLSFFDDGEWHLWIPTSNGLVPIKGFPAEGHYFGRVPELKTDIYLHFLDFIAQQGCWPSVVKPHMGLTEDFFNLGACIKKFDILFDQATILKTATARLVITELEYLFGLCRSIFDLLQEIIAIQWDTVHLIDRSIKKRQLPKTFSDIVLSSNSLRAHADIVEKFKIPSELASFYFRAGPFFQILRTFRDRYLHGGTTLKLVYVTEYGFAVPKNCEPFANFNVWKEEDMLQNELCSLRPAIAHIINETMRACEDYAVTARSIIEYPPPIAPGFKFFMRGYFNESLINSQTALNGAPWWKVK